MKYFKCLKNKDVITAEVSDHHPVIHDGVLFWNVMMRGNIRKGRTGTSYNNGFGIIETDKQYVNRLIKVADVIAEIIEHSPSIEMINLCEGPIQPLHVNTFLQALKKHPSMNRFFVDSVEHTFNKPNVQGFDHWGLLMMTDKKYKVKNVQCDFIEQTLFFNKLANRFHIWELIDNMEKSKYLALGHFPFCGNERTDDTKSLSLNGVMYCNLIEYVINHYTNEPLIFCADFNLNPYLISEWKDRELDKIANDNSILLTIEEGSKKIIDTVTVDGILLSDREKQRYYTSQFDSSLFFRLKKEDELLKKMQLYKNVDLGKKQNYNGMI